LLLQCYCSIVKTPWLMTELFEILTEVWALRALLASSMVGLMCGVLGCFIVLRNMSLVGDALAHAILPGVVVGFLVAGYSALAFFVGAVAAGLVTAFAITWIQQRVKTNQPDQPQRRRPPRPQRFPLRERPRGGGHRLTSYRPG